MEQEKQRPGLLRFGRATCFVVAVVITFALTSYSIFLNRAGVAAIGGAFMLALILIWQIPILESFEVFTLKAKFRAKVDEAEHILQQLRGSASSLGRIAYVQLAYMNRMGDIGWARKRQLLTELDGALRSVGVPDSEIVDLKTPFLNLVSLDLSRVFERDVEYREQHHAKIARAAVSAYPSPIRAGDPEYARLIAESNKFSGKLIDWQDALGNAKLSDLRPVLEQWLAASPLPEADKVKLGPLLDEVVTLSEESWRAGMVTDAAAVFIETHQMLVAQRAKALFGE